LGPCGLLKTSLKSGQIVLLFISPEVGSRYLDIIGKLAEQTGYAITIHPHPDQNAILQIVQREIRGAGWAIRKGPGLHVDRAEIAVSLAESPGEDVQARVLETIERETGYKLVVKG
jgi:hypothetical protein